MIHTHLNLRAASVIAAIAASLVGAAMWRAHRDDDRAPPRWMAGPLPAVAGPSLAVTVIDELGGAVVGARVTITSGASGTDLATDAAGRASLALRAGEVDLVIAAPGFATGAVHTAISAAFPSLLTVVLHPGRSIAGRVVDAAGAPIAGAEISPVDGATLPFGSAAGRGRSPTRSDLGGRFVVTGLGAGRVTLVAHDGEHAPAYSAPIVLGDRDVVDLALTMSTGGVVRGRVIDTAGAPVAAARVRVAGHDPEAHTTIVREVLSSGDGRFAVRGLPRLALVATAETDDAISPGVAVDLAAAATIDLALAATTTIRGVVVAPDGEPAPGAQVTALVAPLQSDHGGPEVSAVLQASCDDAGRFVLRGVAAGARYELAASGSRRGLGPDAPIAVTAGAHDVRLALVVTAGRPAPRRAPVDLPLAQVDRAAEALDRAADRSRARGR